MAELEEAAADAISEGDVDQTTVTWTAIAKPDPPRICYSCDSADPIWRWPKRYWL